MVSLKIVSKAPINNIPAWVASLVEGIYFGGKTGHKEILTFQVKFHLEGQGQLNFISD